MYDGTLIPTPSSVSFVKIGGGFSPPTCKSTRFLSKVTDVDDVDVCDTRFHVHFGYGELRDGYRRGYLPLELDKL